MPGATTPREPGPVRSPGQGNVRVGPLAGLAALVRELGVDPAPVFARQGFTIADFADPDANISYLRAARLLAECLTATGCHHLGLTLGERARPSALGLAGFLVRTAPDVRTALHGLVRHLDLHDRGSTATLRIQGPVTEFSYVIVLPDVPAADQIGDLSMAVFCQIMRSLCGSGWNPSAVRLAHRPPEDSHPHRRVFRAPVYFNADRNATSFPTRWLDLRVAEGDAVLHRHLERQANELHASQTNGLVPELRARLREAMPSRGMGAAAMAAALAMHERTLHRRLRAHGTSFRRELAAVRYATARQLLADTEMTMAQIARSLGYGDSTAFIRAFRQWSGVPPATWRERHGRAETG